jgi:hypothetical protein
MRLKLHFMVTSHPLEGETTLSLSLVLLLIIAPLIFKQFSKPQMTLKMSSSSSRPLEYVLSSLLFFAILVHFILRQLRRVHRNLPYPAKRNLLNCSIINSPKWGWEEPT